MVNKLTVVHAQTILCTLHDQVTDEAAHMSIACAGSQAALRPSQSFSAQQEAAFEPGMRQLGSQLPEQLPAGEVQFYASFMEARLASSCRPQLGSACTAQQLAAACRDGICLRCDCERMTWQLAALHVCS